MSTDLAPAQSAQLQAQATVTPMMLIERAAASGASIEQMQQLFELKLRVEADEARKAFNTAFSDFKSEAVVIAKNTLVHDGPLKGKAYANLFDVVSAVTPALAKHGFSASWRTTKDENAWMEVTCTLKHDQGHYETVSLGAAPDTGAGRNAIQARMSAVSYLQRYSLLMVTGLAAGGVDDDGNGGSKTKRDGMPEDALRSAIDAMQGAGSMEQLKAIYGTAYKQAANLHDRAAMDQLKEYYESRKGKVAA